MANRWLQLKNKLTRMFAMRAAGPRFIDSRLVVIAVTTTGNQVGAGVCFNHEPLGFGTA
ncbi:MAG: hypothetical protein AAB817_01470 [Patescibacteria group bacterium]